MTKNELLSYCLTYADSYEDHPFSDDPNWVALRHKSNKKTFAFIYERNEKLCANLKCDPIRSDFLREVFEGVTPAYHMNKTHWNTVYINEVPEDELYDMLAHSYKLTAQKLAPKSK